MDFLHNQQSDQFLYSFVLPSPQLNEGHPLPSSPPLLWNWNTKNFSLLFQSWFISSNLAFFWTFFIVFMISMMYEYLQFLTFKSESLHANAWRNSEEGRRMLENQGSSSSSFGQETSPTSTMYVVVVSRVYHYF
ncbi:hypothetical protein HMI55_005099 [Coelomomyces lativittatus]|nr:hypothetical protein HMI55_005099 [Coelomomyces lativittatus]